MTTWSGVANGLNGTVLALATTTDGMLYAGGNFSNAGGIAVNCFARYNINSEQWQNIGGTGSVGQRVRAICAQQDQVYVGGTFSQIGGKACNNVAKYHPTQGWTALGNGLSGSINALAVMPNGDLIAGGNFSGNVARYNGSTWTTLGGVGGNVLAVAIDSQGRIWAGGEFSGGLAMWSGSSWQIISMPSTTPGTYNIAHALAADKYGNVYIGANTWLSDRLMVSHLGYVTRNGVINTLWSSSGAVRALVCKNDFLVAAGTWENNFDVYTSLTSVSTGNIHNIQGLKSNAAIYAMAMYKNRLFVGGDFTSGSHGTASKYIATALLNSQPSISLTTTNTAVLDPANASNFMFSGYASAPSTGIDWVQIEAAKSATASPYVVKKCTAPPQVQGGFWYGTFDTLQSGALFVRARVCSNVGVEALSPETWTGEVAGAPTIEIISPTANATASQTSIIMSGNCTNTTQVVLQAWVPNGSQYATANATVTNNTWSGTITGLREGAVALRAVATNAAGDSANKWVSIIVAADLPVVSFSTPSAGSAIKNMPNALNITGTHTNAKSIRIYAYVPGAQSPYDQADCVISGNTWTGKLPNTKFLLTEGGLTVKALGWRENNATGAQSANQWRSFIVDGTPPTARATSCVFYNAQNQLQTLQVVPSILTVFNATIDVVSSATDNGSGVATQKLYLNDVLINTKTYATPAKTIEETSRFVLKPGLNTISIKYLDALGNEGLAVFGQASNFQVTYTPYNAAGPNITIHPYMPSNAKPIASRSVKFGGTCIDDSGIKNVFLDVYQRALVTQYPAILSANKDTWEVEVSNLDDGEIRVVAYGYDLDNLRSSDVERIIIIDTHAPDVFFNTGSGYAQDGANVNTEAISISTFATDSTVIVRHTLRVEYADGTSATFKDTQLNASKTTTAQIVACNLKTGSNKIIATYFDEAGNQGHKSIYVTRTEAIASSPVIQIFTSSPNNTFSELPAVFSVTVTSETAITEYFVDFYPNQSSPAAINAGTPFYRLDALQNQGTGINKAYALSGVMQTIANGATLFSPIKAEHLQDGNFVIKVRASNAAPSPHIIWQTFNLSQAGSATPPSIYWTRPPTPTDMYTFYQDTCTVKTFAIATSNLAEYRLEIQHEDNTTSTAHYNTNIVDSNGNGMRSNQDYQVAVICPLKVGTNVIRATYKDTNNNAHTVTTRVIRQNTSVPSITFDKPENYIFQQLPINFRVTVQSSMDLSGFTVDYFYGWSGSSPNDTTPPTAIGSGQKFYRLTKLGYGTSPIVQLSQDRFPVIQPSLFIDPGWGIYQPPSDIFIPDEPIANVTIEPPDLTYNLYAGMTTVADSYEPDSMPSPLQAAHLSSGAFVVRASVKTVLGDIYSAYRLYRYDTNAFVDFTVTITPNNGTTVNRQAGVNIYFSRPVQVAFAAQFISISQQTGNWVWDANGQLVTYQHMGFGVGNVTIRVDGVRDLNGNVAPVTVSTFTVYDDVAPEIVSVVPGNFAQNIALDTKITVMFSKAMQFATLPNHILMTEKNTGMGIALSAQIGNPNYDNRTAVLSPVAPLLANTEYWISFLHAQILDTNNVALRVSPSVSFTTLNETINASTLMYRITLTPGINGFSLPLAPTSSNQNAYQNKYTNKTITELIEKQIGLGTVQNIRWHNNGKWVTGIPGKEMKVFEWHEAVFVELNISTPRTVVIRGYLINDGNITMPLKKGLNLISIPVADYGITTMRDLLGQLARKMNLTSLTCYMARRFNATDASKKLLGYTFVESENYSGRDLAKPETMERLGGDAVAIVVPKDVTFTLTGVPWQDND